MAVTTKFRRSGIGMHLFNIAKEWFAQKGMKRAEIDVAVANELSTAFWKKMGFKPYKEVQHLEL